MSLLTMRFITVLALLNSIGVGIVGLSNAHAADFVFTPEEFRERYNAQLIADRGDVIKSCSSKDSRRITCNFADAGFQRSVKEMKKLGLAGGRFQLKSLLVIEVGTNKASRIGLTGSRDTPMSLFHLIGQVGSAIKTFEQDIPQDRVTAALKELGLMRGDDDPTISQAKTVELSNVRISCLSQLSTKTNAVVCALTPRG